MLTTDSRQWNRVSPHSAAEAAAGHCMEPCFQLNDSQGRPSCRLSFVRVIPFFWCALDHYESRFSKFGPHY